TLLFDPLLLNAQRAIREANRIVMRANAPCGGPVQLLAAAAASAGIAQPRNRTGSRRGIRDLFAGTATGVDVAARPQAFQGGSIQFLARALVDNRPAPF